VSSASIAILTFRDDLHALVIQRRLRTYPGTVCEVIEADSLADHRTGLTWSTIPDVFPTAIPTRDGGNLDLAACDVLWFRRWNHPQLAADGLTDPAAVEVVNQSCTSTLLGALLNRFAGAWVSHPEATRRAENKLVQLRAAATAGFRVPRTLVSQDPCEIRRFCELLDGHVIVKAVQGTPRSQLYTVKLTAEHLENDDWLRLCPTIFQEYVPGTRHVRALCCGSQTYAAMIDSPELDWRRNLDVPVTPLALDCTTGRRLADVLRIMELKMGVVDLKLNATGEPVWLELNPQGQFLFVEGLTGLDLTGAFSDFLHGEARGLAA
jgi:glutathione synthase/RimK-type ligase-like ATP-grasp enzyme